MCDCQAKYTDWPNQLNWTGYESGTACEIGSGTYAIGLISWAASEGSAVSSLICDHWLTRKLATFMGSTDSLECSIRLTWRSVAAARLDLPIANLRGGGWGLASALLDWTCSKPLEKGAGGKALQCKRAHVTLHSTSALLGLGTQSRPQVVQSIPFT